MTRVAMTSGSSAALEMVARVWGEGLVGVACGGIKSTYMSSERNAVASIDFYMLHMTVYPK